jgi:hypothetical protein
MDELPTEAFKLLASLTEEQLQSVLAYARALREAEWPGTRGLEDLLEESA